MLYKRLRNKVYYSEHRELYSNMGMRIEYTIFLMMRLNNRNYSAILATLQITSYALGV
jgi:hypothetical protein